ncbi:unnamed protein product [Coffea canephora]|uniref:26S proteasome non-ATPase regulatory subunit 1/RPN2 N-terminal domain-containing protein n=1 Tax=Coffea canephora TaxID=49390 RepID=A0A068V3R6_COFCA|nr:unnamed protein product [Coffea canephora]
MHRTLIIETIYEDEEFDETQRQLAALLASKIQRCFCCIFNSLLPNCSFATCLVYLTFSDNVSEDLDYVWTILAKAIDECPDLKTKAAKSNKATKIDPRSKAIVERMLDKYIINRRYQ